MAVTFGAFLAFFSDLVENCAASKTQLRMVDIGRNGRRGKLPFIFLEWQPPGRGVR